MPEPTTTATATFIAASATVPIITAFGVPLGLRADLLVAGFSGSLVGIILLNTVPGTSDTWQELLRTTTKRMFVALASSLTAGYLTPLTLLFSHLPDNVVLGAAFAVGGGAQQVLMFAIQRLKGSTE